MWDTALPPLARSGQTSLIDGSTLPAEPRDNNLSTQRSRQPLPLELCQHPTNTKCGLPCSAPSDHTP